MPGLGAFRCQLRQDGPDRGTQALGRAPPVVAVQALGVTLDLGHDVARHAHGTVGGAVGDQGLNAGDVADQPDDLVKLVVEFGAFALVQRTVDFVHQLVGLEQALGGDLGPALLLDARVLGFAHPAVVDRAQIAELGFQRHLLRAHRGGGVGHHAQLFRVGTHFAERHQQGGLCLAGDAAHAHVVVGEQMGGEFRLAEADQNVTSGFVDDATTGKCSDHATGDESTRGARDFTE